MTRTILHVDMDQFYAAVEIRDRPELAGKPVIIGADPQAGRGRGVVSTASYEARKFGVHSALPISTAWRLCPQGVYLYPNMEKYAAVSDQIHAVFARYTPLVEPLSLDEAFLDVTASRLLVGDGARAGEGIKREIFEATQLKCSVGVAPNKFLAKIASDLRKPDALVVVRPGDEAAFLAPLPVSRMWGVGPKTEEVLLRLGLRTIGDIQKAAEARLNAELGSWGPELKALALGQDERPVESEQEAKSLGRETTFDHDTDSKPLLRQTLAELCEDVAARLRRYAWQAGQATLKLRWEGFETHTRQRALHPATSHGPDLLAAVLPFMDEFLKARRKVRLVGVTAGKLAHEGAGGQMELLNQGPDKKRQADLALDLVQGRFGKKALQRASTLERVETEGQERARLAGQEKLRVAKFKKKGG